MKQCMRQSERDRQYVSTKMSEDARKTIDGEDMRVQTMAWLICTRRNTL
jgi:hypothetical protein